MWSTILLVNSILFVIAAFFLVYFFGAAVLLWNWKPFFLDLLICTFLAFSEVAIAAICEP